MRQHLPALLRVLLGGRRKVAAVPTKGVGGGGYRARVVSGSDRDRGRKNLRVQISSTVEIRRGTSI